MDRVSGPAGKMMKTMDTVTSNIQTGYQKIGYGVAGLFSVGYAFDKMLAPAKEMRTALGTISSLGVENAALENLRKTSMATAVQYGSDATEIVNASYKLQSAISGLKGNELSMLANKSAMLATATKGGLESTNAYVGQMFNIHAVEADAIGKTAFMDKLISKTAKAVQLFNTDGTQMGEAMKNIGKQATAMKVPLEEQLAVMGFLQNTMVQGGKSGTAYSAFLANISKAEGVLGMKFTDSQNKALPMVDIITKLEGKFGDLSKAGDQEMLQKAFGKSGQQVLAAMAGSLDTFKGNLDSIKAVKGLDDVTAMAMAIADPWDQSSAAVKNFRMEFGERLLKVFSPVYDKISLTMTTLTKWMDMFPHLTGWVIKGVIGIGVLVGALSALSVAVGLSKFIMVGWTASAVLMKFALVPFGPLLTATKAGWLAMNLSIALGNGVMATAKFGLLGMLGSMKMMMLQSKLAAATIWIFNGGLTGMAAALWANPITWIVVGVLALTAAVVAAVVYWDEWTGKLLEWGSTFLDFIGVFSLVDDVLAVWDKLPQWWASFKNWIGGMDLFSFVGDSIDWLIDKINMIPGINIDTSTDMPKPVSAPESLSKNSSPQMTGGGLVNQISNATSNNSSRSIGDVNINNYGQAMSGQSLANELAFAVG
jgi:TP901 family phage tail tape measure protein